MECNAVGKVGEGGLIYVCTAFQVRIKIRKASVARLVCTAGFSGASSDHWGILDVPLVFGVTVRQFHQQIIQNTHPVSRRGSTKVESAP